MANNNEAIKEQINNFETICKKKSSSLKGKQSDVYYSIDNFSNNNRYQCVDDLLDEFKKSKYKTLSEFFKHNYKDLVKTFVTSDYIDQYYYIIDHLTEFPFSSGLDRRTVRTSDCSKFIKTALTLLNDYRLIDFYGGNITNYLTDNMSEVLVDCKNSYFYSIRTTDMGIVIASAIDNSYPDLKDSITNIINSDRNTATVTASLIRGIIMSHDSELHALLGDFLLAAKLQEGVRQVICENADCGTSEAFRVIFNVIYDNNLIRYSSIKRAIATWTGLCDPDNLDRISSKILESIHNSINDKKTALEYINSNDSILIMIGLWSIGFDSVEEAISIMQDLADNGTKNQLLTIGYYNTMLYYNDFQDITASKVIKAHKTEYDIVAVYMDSFLTNCDHYTYEALNYNYNRDNNEKKYLTVPINYLYDSKESAYEFFEIMKEIYSNIPKKKFEFSPIIFPWYSTSLTKSQLIKRMCITAYSLADDKLIDYVVNLLSELDTSGYDSSRSHFTELLLHNPHTDIQRKAIINSIADKETYTRKTAFELVGKMNLSEDDYILIEGFLKFKTADIRKKSLELLKKQKPDNLAKTITRLIHSNKSEIRTGGLTLLSEMKKDDYTYKNEASKYIEELTAKLSDIENPDSNESILIEELSINGNASKVLNDKGYGLFNPDIEINIPEYKVNLKLITDYFNISENELDNAFTSLDKFIDEHGMLEYKNCSGEERLLCNGLYQIKYSTSKDNVPIYDCYPFKELWIECYEKYIKTPRMLNLMKIVLISNSNTKESKNKDFWKHIYKLLGKDYTTYHLPECNYLPSAGWDYSRRVIPTVITILCELYPDTEYTKVSREINEYIANEIPDNLLWFENDAKKSNYCGADDEINIYTNNKIEFASTYSSWNNNNEFIDRFYTLYKVDKKFEFNKHNVNKNRYYCSPHNYNKLGIFDYVKAYTVGIIPEDEVYKAIFETIGLNISLDYLSSLLLDTLRPYEKNILRPYIKNGEIDSSDKLYQNGVLFYTNVIEKVLDVELRRGDLPTVFSGSINKVKRIYGLDKLVRILTAMGKDNFDRKTYYYSSDNATSRKEVFSHLLQVCYPNKDDNANKLSNLIKECNKAQQKQLNEKRLIETMMYAPQWIDIIEDYLGYKGLKNGCYYFMAHMNERFDDKKTAIIAKYSPLSIEELNNGAFDVKWFKSAYETLGEKLFDQLYDSAKYISDGNKHSRARKYADAALGKVKTKDLEVTISDKRNKDLLMSYGIVPLKNENDLLHRYEFIQKFFKESKQFGAQRKQSEALAVDMTLKNLSTSAGFADVTRLTLAMENKLAKENSSLFDWYEVDADSKFLVKLEADEYGQIKIVCMKNDKPLKSVPAALKKNEYILNLKDVQKKLKSQYSRTVKMFEQAMEDGELYTVSEIKAICENPVIAPIVKSLVYVTPDNDFLTIDDKDKLDNLDLDSKLKVAHPYDMYKEGCWSFWQETLFNNISNGTMPKQPFKQVFRELYVKLDEELDKKVSRMFAGNQIQPQKTVGCLKNRRWIADYEEGLQKIYYNDNIIARIYALADWFSPSDIEAPTLEYVEFSNRKTFESLSIKDVPDVIYSEVMRDVDLAVSVAHVGGVDPETSHSTMEMRKVIIEHNLPLLKLSNVSFEGSHIIIEGKLAKYSVHLGSGVIHILGGKMINIIPVQSGQRGPLFIPFVDQDPKTAEIMSKVLMLAKDEKIKDPYILQQIKRL